MGDLTLPGAGEASGSTDKAPVASFSALPSVDRLLGQPAIAECVAAHGQALVKRAINDELTAQREALQQELKPDMLRTYQQIFKARKGIAVVLVDNEHCFGCSMKIPPQIYNEVVQGDTLHTCPHCRRILYVDRSAVAGEQQSL